VAQNRPVYVAFATGPRAQTARFLDSVEAANPAAILVVVSRLRPHRGEWVEIQPGQGVRAMVAACRKAVAGRRVDGVAIHATKGGGEWRMRMAAWIIAGRRLRIYNDNLDHFPVGETRVLWQHLNWRWSQRSRGVLWWKMLARLAMICADWRRGGQRTPKRFPAAALMPGISLVIPTRDGRELLAAMLPPVVADLEGIPSEIIVVDNGSSDGTEAFLRERYPAIRVESSASPLSFAAAVNRGINAARFSHVVLLNNDMQIEPGFFAALRGAFDRVPDLFCSTAQIFFPEGQRREETGLCFWKVDPRDDFPVYCAEPEAGEDGTLVLYGSGGCSMYDAA
jgi:hypothetical protein